MKLKIYCSLFSILLGISITANCQTEVVHLWEKGAPGFENRKDIPEQAKDWWVRSINNPSITVFYPPKEKANGCAVLVAPGGGFRNLVYNAEGKQAAEYLNSIGITAFVLKYRLPKEENSPYSLNHVKQDAYRAMRLIRSSSDKFHIDPNRLGILGFSAGGAIIMMIAFEEGEGDPAAIDSVDRQNGRPDFEMIVYPGGKAPKEIPQGSPPAFLICANDDEYGCDSVSIDLLLKFREAKVPVEAIFLASGKHAFNMGDRSPLVTIRTWPQRMADWLIDSGFLNAGYNRK